MSNDWPWSEGAIDFMGIEIALDKKPKAHFRCDFYVAKKAL